MDHLHALRHALVNLPRYGKQAIAIAADWLLLFLAFHLALWLRFELFFSTVPYLWTRCWPPAPGWPRYGASASTATSCGT